jgi:hypothetical protein
MPPSPLCGDEALRSHLRRAEMLAFDAERRTIAFDAERRTIAFADEACRSNDGYERQR